MSVAQYIDDNIAHDQAIPIPEDGWTVEQVEDRLVAAIRYAERASGRAGPRAFGGAWPDYQYDWADLIAQQDRPEREKDEEARYRNRYRAQYTSREVTLAEEALAWPARFVADREVRRILLMWMFAKAKRIPWLTVVKRRGIARETARRRRARAVHAIIVGLTQAGVPGPDAI